MNNQRTARILIVDYDELSRKNLEKLLAHYFVNVTSANCYQDAFTQLNEHQYDIVISSFILDEYSGLDIRKWQIAHQPHGEFILTTAYSQEVDILEHSKTDPIFIIQKPTQENELIAILFKFFPQKKVS